MDIDPHTLPEEASLLRQIVLQLLGVVEEKDRLLERVQHQLKQLLRQRYGQKRERIDENQLFLFAAQIIAASQASAASARPEPPATGSAANPSSQATQRPRPQTAARILGATPRGFRPGRDPAAMSALPQ
jgi:transposase